MTDWTVEEEQELIRMFSEGMTYDQIAPVMGRNRNSISGKCRRLRLRRGNMPSLGDPQARILPGFLVPVPDPIYFHKLLGRFDAKTQAQTSRD